MAMISVFWTGSASKDNNRSGTGKGRGAWHGRFIRLYPLEHGIEFFPGKPDHGRPAMGAGEGIFHPPELVHDPLALLPRADRPCLDRPPAGNDPGDTLPVADGLRGLFADKVADDLVDDRGLLDAAKHDRDCPDKERVAAKLFKDETLKGKCRAGGP